MIDEKFLLAAVNIRKTYISTYMRISYIRMRHSLYKKIPYKPYMGKPYIRPYMGIAYIR